MNKAIQELYDKFIQELEQTKQATTVVAVETPRQKEKRIKRLLADPLQFIYYYFEHYMDCELGYFQIEMIEAVVADPSIFFIGEWPREHAKSVIAGVFIPMYLLAIGELTGMILASQSEKSAVKLLLSIKKELMGNQKFINDFGDLTKGQSSTGSNEFVIKGNIGFLAVGLGQSARGYRVVNNRPNYILADDMDTLQMVRNESRVIAVRDWFLEDVYPASSILGGRTVAVGNRIHRASVLAHLVGDISPEHPKRAGIYHSKVYATEDPATKEKLPLEVGTPAWKERYTVAILAKKWKILTQKSILREYYHEHVIEGLTFKANWIHWGETLSINDYDHLVVYGDPSFTSNKDSDYKAVVAVGNIGHYYHVLKSWVRIDSILSMVRAYYAFYELFGDAAEYWIEANGLQKEHMINFSDEAKRVGFTIPIRADTEAKPNKIIRIENMSPDFENGYWLFSSTERDSPDMMTLEDQLLLFPSSAKDDAPDALQGAWSKIRKKAKNTTVRPTLGTYINRGLRRHRHKRR